MLPTSSQVAENVKRWTFRALDMLPKTRNQSSMDRSAFSGLVTIFAVFMVVSVTVTELSSFISPPARSSVSVDLGGKKHEHGASSKSVDPSTISEVDRDHARTEATQY